MGYRNISFYKAVRVEVTNTESTILKMGSYYFLASLTAWNVVKPFNATDRASGSYAYIALGGIVLCFYLIGKLQKSRIKLFGNQGRFSSELNQKNQRLHLVLIGITLLLYVITVLFPQIADNVINAWFYGKIAAIYDTVFLNFIFGIVGAVFLLQILIRGQQPLVSYWICWAEKHRQKALANVRIIQARRILMIMKLWKMMIPRIQKHPTMGSITTFLNP